MFMFPRLSEEHKIFSAPLLVAEIEHIIKPMGVGGAEKPRRLQLWTYKALKDVLSAMMAEFVHAITKGKYIWSEHYPAPHAW